MFGFRVADPHAATDYQMGPTKKKLVDLRETINLATLCMLIIDEISYVCSKFLGRIEKRLREIMAKKNIPFGGLAVLVVGGMYQFPPVDGTALYISVADQYLRNKKLVRPRHYRWRPIFGHISQNSTETTNEIHRRRKAHATNQQTAPRKPTHVRHPSRDRIRLSGPVKKACAIRCVIRFKSNRCDQ